MALVPKDPPTPNREMSGDLAAPAGPPRLSVRCPCCSIGFGMEALPLCLPCGHTVCESCKDAGACHATPACPVCDKPLSSGETTINTALAHYAQSTGAAPAEECEDCREDGDAGVPATFRCEQCNNRLVCEGHEFLLHRKRKHVGVVPHAPLGSVPASCLEHTRNTLGFFCMTDLTPVCHDCTVVKHPTASHEVLEVVDAARRLQRGLPEMVTACYTAAASAASACAKLLTARDVMVSRKDASLGTLREGVAAVKAALDALVDSHEKRSAELCSARSKVIEAHANELSVAESQLSSAAGMCKAAASSEVPLVVARAHQFAQRMVAMPHTLPALPFSTHVEVVCDMSSVLAALERAVILRSRTVDPAKCVVSGSGVSAFRTGESADATSQNTFTITCTDDACSADAAPLTLDDVSVSVSRRVDACKAAATVPSHGVVLTPGTLSYTYTVPEDVDAAPVDAVEIHVRVHGGAVTGSPFVVPAFAQRTGTLVKSFPVECGKTSGIAVTVDGESVFLTSHDKHCVMQYSTRTLGLVRTMGTQGSGPGQLTCPLELCCTPVSTMIIVDAGNSRLEEWAYNGEHRRTLGAGTSFSTVSSDGNIVIGGVRGAALVLFDYKSGTQLRRFGTEIGLNISSLFGYSSPATGIWEGSIVVPEYSNKSVAWFKVTDGSLIQRLAIPSTSAAHKAIDVATNGDILLADYGNHTVSVLSSAGAVLHTWGKQGTGPGEFQGPTGVAVRSGFIYVVEEGGTRVQVFSHSGLGRM